MSLAFQSLAQMHLRGTKKTYTVNVFADAYWSYKDTTREDLSIHVASQKNTSQSIDICSASTSLSFGMSSAELDRDQTWWPYSHLRDNSWGPNTP